MASRKRRVCKHCLTRLQQQGLGGSCVRCAREHGITVPSLRERENARAERGKAQLDSLKQQTQERESVYVCVDGVDFEIVWP